MSVPVGPGVRSVAWAQPLESAAVRRFLRTYAGVLGHRRSLIKFPVQLPKGPCEET